MLTGRKLISYHFKPLDTRHQQSGKRACMPVIVKNVLLLVSGNIHGSQRMFTFCFVGGSNLNSHFKMLNILNTWEAY